MRFGWLLLAGTCSAACAAMVGMALGGCAPMAPVDRALSLVRQERRPEAEHLLEQDLIEHPDDVPARKLLVRLLGFDGDLARARYQVDELRKRVPQGDPTPEIELGHAYELAHKFEEALAAYDALVKKHPGYAAGQLGRAYALAKLGRKDDAKRALDEAERLGAPKANVAKQRAALAE